MKKNSLFVFILFFAFFLPNFIWAQSEDDSSEETTSTYQASNASEFEEDLDYADAYKRYQEQKTSSDLIATERLRNWSDAVTIGFKGALGSPTFVVRDGDGWSFDDWSFDDWSFGLSMNLGLIMKVRLADNFALTPELTASYRYLSKEKKETGYTIEATLSNVLIELPILFRFFLDNTEGVYVFAGPEIGLVLYNKSTEKVIFENAPPSNGDAPIQPASVEIGIVLGVGYQINRWVALDLRAFYSLTNYANETLSNDGYTKMNTLYFQFSGSYFF